MVWPAALHLVQQYCILISCWGTSITLSLTRISSTEFLISFTVAPETSMEQLDPSACQLYWASVYLMRAWQSHGQGAMEVTLPFLLSHPFLRKRRYSPPEWRAEGKEVLRGKILGWIWIFHHRSQYSNTFMPHPDCQLQTSPSACMWHFHINAVIRWGQRRPPSEHGSTAAGRAILIWASSPMFRGRDLAEVSELDTKRDPHLQGLSAPKSLSSKKLIKVLIKLKNIICTFYAASSPWLLLMCN